MFVEVSLRFEVFVEVLKMEDREQEEEEEEEGEGEAGNNAAGPEPAMRRPRRRNPLQSLASPATDPLPLRLRLRDAAQRRRRSERSLLRAQRWADGHGARLRQRGLCFIFERWGAVEPAGTEGRAPCDVSQGQAFTEAQRLALLPALHDRTRLREEL